MAKRARKNQPTKSRVITVRVTEEEGTALDHWADVSGLSLSDYIRNMGRPPIVQTGSNVYPTWTVRCN
jgi:predicted DNA binding CopG/RHH family protein